jgi:hypothetical protein
MAVALALGMVVAMAVGLTVAMAVALYVVKPYPPWPLQKLLLEKKQ